MPTRKQKRREAKSKRHDYEIVYVDDEGNEVEPAPEELEAAKAERPERRNGAKPTAGKKPVPSRSRRTPPAPTWRRSFKRAGLLGIVVFALFALSAKNKSGGYASAAGLASSTRRSSSRLRTRSTASPTGAGRHGRTGPPQPRRPSPRSAKQRAGCPIVAVARPGRERQQDACAAFGCDRVPLIRQKVEELARDGIDRVAAGLDANLAATTSRRAVSFTWCSLSSCPGSSAIRTTRLSPSWVCRTTGDREPSGVSISLSFQCCTHEA